MHEGHHDILEDLDDLDAAFGKTPKKEEKKQQKPTHSHEPGADQGLDRVDLNGAEKNKGKDS